MLGRNFLSRAIVEGAECGGKHGGMAINYSLGGSGTGGSGGAAHLVLWLVGVWIECCEEIWLVRGQVEGPEVIGVLVASACQDYLCLGRG